MSTPKNASPEREQSVDAATKKPTTEQTGRDNGQTRRTSSVQSFSTSPLGRNSLESNAGRFGITRSSESNPHSATRRTLQRRLTLQRLILTLSGITLVLLSIACICIGAADISFPDVWLSIYAGITGNGRGALSMGTYAIIWDIRLPRVAMALIAGAALSTCGVGMQGVLRNPLVSPYTLGISSGAAFGASLVIVLGAGMLSRAGENVMIIASAFLFALLAVSFVLFLARMRNMKAETLILAGIAVMYAFSAGTSILQYMATHDELAQIVFWLMGSLSSASWKEVGITAVLLAVGFPILYRLSWNLNIMASGEDVAKSLGTRPGRVMVVTILTSAVVTATVVSFTGIIGFIGLVGPHIARLLLGHDHRLLYPAAGLLGAFLLTLSDTVARTLLGYTEIPIGIVTSLIGVPFFVSILMRRRRISAV